MNKKIALVGCGIWGQNILKELIILNSEVHVFETNPALRDTAIKLGAVQFSDGLPSVNDNFDGLIVATPSTTHRPVLEKLAGLDIPVFLEKPLTTNLEDALALRELSHDDIYLMHIWLYHPGILMLKDIAQSKELGNVLGVRSTRANWTSPRTDTDSVWNLSPHDITIAKAVLGYIPDPKSAIAECHHGIIRGLVALLGDDPYCIFEVSNRYERKVREVRIHCEKGVAILEDEKVDAIKIVRGDAASDPKKMEIEFRKFDKTPPLRFEIREFLDFLNGGATPRSSFEDGLEVIKTIHDIVELAK
ncbi:Gfo/Idh/MocA family protein [Rhodohalobacter sp. 614A]|uniref:Gfo/Idh/MocA family protein n=1 Tax=Rhodohalobacter sp. 614A TaxID=2908649 RepID=UPI001F23773D|nr:Gfo/Idh/MocA family oxidoreductase [Rhodohalobacter sp. 614A]